MVGAELRTDRRGAREAEGAPLLREYRVKSSIEGSNPSLSARCEKGPKGPFFVGNFGRRSCCRRDRCRVDPGLDEVRGGKNNGELRARSSVG